MASGDAPFAGLGKTNAELVLDIQARRPVRTPTLDVDATIIGSNTRAARRTYEGGRGYQPVRVLWTCPKQHIETKRHRP